MGCSKSCEKSDAVNIPHHLEKLIDNNSISGLSKFCYEQNVSPQINMIKLKLNSLVANPLGYALAKGKLESFKYIYTRLDGLIHDMEEIFNNQGYRSIDIVCIQGHLQMLSFYLPVYISIFLDNTPSTPKDPHDTLSFTSIQTPNLNPFFKFTPIQYACYYEHFSLIRFFRSYFIEKPIPYLFDLEYQDEVTGENCALISCKYGNYKLMKFLHEECKSNFEIINKRDENAIVVLAAASSRCDNYDYLVCLRYLVKVIRIDPRFRHEDVVLLLNNYKLLQIFYEALEPYGIIPDKEILENLNLIRCDYQESNNEDLNFFELNSAKPSVLSTIKNDDATDISGISGISTLLKSGF